MDELLSIEAPDYQRSFSIDIPADDARRPLDWARAVFEDAPAAVRAVLTVGWRFGLLLRPGSSSPRVLGWSVITDTEHAVVLQRPSKLLSANNIWVVEDSRVTWTTAVHFDTRVGAVVWRIAAPLHHFLAPRLLRRALRT